jgi:hypothetical protein
MKFEGKEVERKRLLSKWTETKIKAWERRVCMRAKIIAVILCVALVLPVMGCTTIEEHPGTAAGAGIGAGAGAIAGSAIGESTTSAVVGGLLGALIGGAVGYYAYDRDRTAEETSRMYNYTPAEGSLLNIEQVSNVPQIVRPGENVDLNMTYAVLTPERAGTSQITEIRTIRHNGQLVGRPTVTVSRSNGTFTSTIPLQLPPDAAPGTYTVTDTVESTFGRDSRESSFTVAYAY